MKRLYVFSGDVYLLPASPSLQLNADISKAGHKGCSINLSDDGLLVTSIVSTSAEKNSLENLEK